MGRVYGDRWETQSNLGEGGQAHVFVVRDLQATDSLAVLKRLKNPDRVERFRDEVAALKALNHSQIVKIFDHEFDAPKPYFVMELCSGTLEERLQHERLSVEEALEIAADLASTVGAAHAAGVVHRDIKPSNVLFRHDDSRPVLADFGLCQIVDGEVRNTATNERVGAVYYMAPEMEDGRVDLLSPRSDVYSLGKVLYALLREGRIFSREKHREPQWQLSNVIDPWTASHIDVLLDRMVVADPALRFQDGNTAALAIREVIRVIDGQFNPIRANLPQKCRYCGSGNYSEFPADDSTALFNLGIGLGKTATVWKVLICERCGNVQTFAFKTLDERAAKWPD